MTILAKNKFFLYIFLVLLLSFFAFLSVRISFSLAQGGDDWGIHYLIWQIFDLAGDASYFNPFTYFCTYCPHYFFLSIISRVFGYEHFYYFLANFIARVIAGLSLFFLVKHITKESLIAALASIFFVITYLGIEATDWAFNYNYILGIGVMSFLFIRYWIAKETGKIKNTFIAGLLVAASAIIAPARMHGLIPLLLIAEVAWWVIEGRKFNLKKSFIRLSIASILYYIVLYGVSDLYIYLRDSFHIEIGPYYVGNGYGAKEWNTSRVWEGINFIREKISHGQSDLIIDPIATLGNYIMPDMLWSAIPFSKISIFGKSSFTFFPYLFPLSVAYGSLTLLILFLAGIKRKIAFFYIGNLILWMIFIYFLHKATANTFSYPRVAFSLIGGFTIIFSVWIFFLLKKSKPLIAHTLILGLGWMFTFILFPWIIGPFGIITTWSRYSIQQGAGLAIWMALIFFITIEALNRKRRYTLLGITYLLILLFIFMHIKFSNDYLGYVATYRSREIDTRFWNKIITDVPSLDTQGLNIFLMLTDQPSAQIAEAIRFGFYGRASIHYNTRVWEYSPFMVVNEYESVLSSVYDGRYLKKQGRKPIPTTVDRVYAFVLQNREIYNVTAQVREKLNGDLKALNKGDLILPQEFQ